MAKGKLVAQLDIAVEAMVSNPDAPRPATDRRIEAMLRIAGELASLPDPRFRSRLRAELIGAAQGRSPRARVHAGNPGAPLRTSEDIEARLKEIASAPPLSTYDVGAGFDATPDGTMRFLTAMGPWTVVLSHYSGDTNWERHPAGDELLYVMDGGLDVTALTPAGPVRTLVDAGQVFICPKGLWHRPRPRGAAVRLLSLTPGEGTEHSDERYPVRAARKRPALASRGSGRAAPPRVKFPAHDVRATLDRAPELIISSTTTAQEADAAFPTIAKFANYTLSGGRFAGLTPWERHPDGDEMLYALEGGVDVTVLTARGPVERTIPEGSVFICPQGLWHRQRSQGLATMLYATPTETSEHSFADDPRAGAPD
jgi:quercetin dioxygenase-like cupin family protein